MRTISNILLIIAIAVLGYMCTMSILTPIRFEREMERREKIVIPHLVDIRKAQVEFKNQKGHYTADCDSLIDFIRNGRVPQVLKEGTLTDEQLANGLTERKALKIVQSGNRKAIEANGLQNFRRDTSYITVYDKLFAQTYKLEDIDKIVVIPFSGGKRFEMAAVVHTNTTTGISVPLFYARASYETYLGDLNHQELVNLIDLRTKLEKYPGLQVGSIDEPNNNAGNWE